MKPCNMLTTKYLKLLSTLDKFKIYVDLSFFPNGSIEKVQVRYYYFMLYTLFYFLAEQF